MTKQQAVALADEIKTAKELGRIFSPERVEAMLNDHRQQIIAELAQQTGAMPPEVENVNFVKVCNAQKVREALAAMQARVEQLEAEMADQGPYINKLRDQNKELRARVEQLERALNRVKYEAVSLADAQVVALEAMNKEGGK